jgi:protein phosphatase-4 regulatory subunit 3
MSFIIQLNINAFINFLLSEQPESTQLVSAITYMLETGDQGLQIQISEIIKFLLEPSLEKKVEIQDFIYDHFFPEFHKHFNKLERNEVFYSFVQQYLEILIYCVKNHGYRIRHYIIQQKLIQDLLKGITQPEKTLALAVIRLIKNITIGQDEFLIKYLIQNDIYNGIFEVYLKNAQKDNLLKSAILELLNLPAKEKIKKLVIYLTEKFKPTILENKLEKNFEKLFTKYEIFTANENHNIENEQSQVGSDGKTHTNHTVLLPV